MYTDEREADLYGDEHGSADHGVVEGEAFHVGGGAEVEGLLGVFVPVVVMCWHMVHVVHDHIVAPYRCCIQDAVSVYKTPRQRMCTYLRPNLISKLYCLYSSSLRFTRFTSITQCTGQSARYVHGMCLRWEEEAAARHSRLEALSAKQAHRQLMSR